MKINKVTITGADDGISTIWLPNFNRIYPFVEWGILFSKSKIGSPRYPSNEWIDELVKQDIDLSAHFCGWWSKEVIENNNFNVITELPTQFKRVQLNYSFRNPTQSNLNLLVDYAKKHPERSYILQYNKTNKTTIDKLLLNILPPNIHFLYDASGGRGVEIQSIAEPFLNYTGYSGGLNPKNIENVCNLIQDVDRSDNVWIDLESGVRTDDHFDVKKVKLLLDIAADYVNIK